VRIKFINYQEEKMTRIILRGCNGRMGQEITRLIKNEKDACIIAGIDLKESADNDYPVFTSIWDCNVAADVIIDFRPQKS
jgi:4-hydroxy-tetrahydrodipicolinate reductase